jgi:hypothetical protein
VKRDSITIVLVSESREPLSLEFSLKEMILIAAFLILLLGASIYSMLNFKDLKSEQSHLTNTIQSLNAELAEREDRISMLSEKIDAQKNLVLLVDRQDTTAASPSLANDEIKIEDLEIESLDRGLSLNFRLLNSSQEKELISGYMMIIVEHQSGEYDKFGTFPEFPLASGEPINYQDGDTYAIRNFKRVTTRIPLVEEPEKYRSMKLIVFSDEGEILIYDNHILEW